MLSDLGEALTNVSLQLGIWMRNEGSKIWDSSLVNDSLSKFFGVLGDFSKGGGRDSLKSKLWLLDTKNEETNGSSIDNSLSELVVVLGNA